MHGSSEFTNQDTSIKSRRWPRRGGGLLILIRLSVRLRSMWPSSRPGAACDAVDRVLAGEDKTALCLVRPPGHHALAERAMGFCLFSNVAIAATVARDEHGLDRVLIVDWDVHHGNGTQDIFYADERVGFFSIHRWPFYPGTGDADETGTGAGLGATRQFAGLDSARRDKRIANRSRRSWRSLPIGSGRSWCSSARDSTPTALTRSGRWGWRSRTLPTLTKIVRDVAAVHADGRDRQRAGRRLQSAGSGGMRRRRICAV